MNDKHVTISFRVPSELRNELNDRASKDGKTQGQWLLDLLAAELRRKPSEMSEIEKVLGWRLR